MHSFGIQDDRNTHFPSTTSYKNNSIIKRFYIENSPLDGTVQSGQSATMQYAGQQRALSKNFGKKNILIQLTKSPIRPANSEFCQAPKPTTRAVEYLNER